MNVIAIKIDELAEKHLEKNLKMNEWMEGGSMSCNNKHNWNGPELFTPKNFTTLKHVFWLNPFV